VARAADIPLAADLFHYMAGWATKIEGNTINISVPYMPGANFHSYTLREPVGVVGQIIPWNFPLLMAAWKLGPSLEAGTQMGPLVSEEQLQRVTGYLESGKAEGGTQVDNLPGSAFAFPGSRKEPLVSASHARDALARFDQVQGVSDADRALAFANILEAASYFGVHVKETSWRDLMRPE